MIRHRIHFTLAIGATVAAMAASRPTLADDAGSPSAANVVNTLAIPDGRILTGSPQIAGYGFGWNVSQRAAPIFKRIALDRDTLRMGVLDALGAGSRLSDDQMRQLVARSQRLLQAPAENTNGESATRQDAADMSLVGADGLMLADDSQQLSYAAGVTVANVARQMFGPVGVDQEALVAGAEAGLLSTSSFDDDVVAQFTAHVRMLVAAHQAREDQLRADAARQALETQAQQADVTITASGLRYRALRTSHGARPEIEQAVHVHYQISLVGGPLLDDTWAREAPVLLPVQGVFAGWAEAVTTMSVGSIAEFWVPPSLGYGREGAAFGVPPHAALHLKVELLGIQEVKQPDVRMLRHSAP